MAASVTIHHKAFSDPRIAYLGQLAGYSVDEALGRLARLWSVCTERQLWTPDPREIRACLGPKGDALVVEAGLAELLPDGAIRVRGCEGRIEWFGKLPGQQVEAGKARAAAAPRDARGRMLPKSAGPALDPALDPATPARWSPAVQRKSSGVQPQSQSQSQIQEREQRRSQRFDRSPRATAPEIQQALTPELPPPDPTRRRPPAFTPRTT